MARQTLLLGALAVGVLAQDATTPPPSGSTATTITILAGTLTSGLAGSIVSVSGCHTTVALQCTDESHQLCASAPGVTITATEGPTFYEVAYSTSTPGASGFLSQSCSLEGPAGSFTRAVCTEVVSFSGGAIDRSTSTQATITNPADFTYARVPITAGASKLPSGSQTACTTTDSGAAAPAGFSEVYRVLVPLGAALAAGAGALL